MDSSLISNIGLWLTFVGAVFTLFEAVWPYKGPKYNDERDPFVNGLDPAIDGGFRTETEQYKKWKKRRNISMLVGLFVIGFGILLQMHQQ